MDKNMEILWSKLDEKLNHQTKFITESVTKNVLEAINEKIKTLTEKNTMLKTKVSNLEQKMNTLQKEKRKYNLVFYGIEETGKTEPELIDHIKETVIDSGIHLDSQEISNIYRIGQKLPNKTRPIVATITSTWKKHLILKNKKRLPQGVFVKEDFPKEILEKRKQLQSKVDEEKRKGNVAFIKYDKLIIKKASENHRDKRKREDSISPNLRTQKKASYNELPSPPTTREIAKENKKPNILNYVERGRTTSTSELPKNM